MLREVQVSKAIHTRAVAQEKRLLKPSFSLPQTPCLPPTRKPALLVVGRQARAANSWECVKHHALSASPRTYRNGSICPSAVGSKDTRHDRRQLLPVLRASAVPVSAASVSWAMAEPSASERKEEQRRSSGNGSEDEGHAAAPSCMFFGPLDSADRSTLEEFYRQAKDSYYSGKPLILDEMFDQVEVQLRWLRSPVVQKYPRCSLQSCTTYSDAEDDPSQLAALYAIWASLLSLGAALALGPVLFTLRQIWEHATSEDVALGISSLPGPLLCSSWAMLCAVSMGLGVTLGNSAWHSLRDLWSGEMLALKGVCPACAEEVYAFVKVEDNVKRPKRKTECHVCGQRLVFHAILRPQPGHPTSHLQGTTSSASRKSQSTSSQKAGSANNEPVQWAYGRVYAVAKPEDLKPKS